jgi:TPP-dependent pyruvate/acetoin dehydrogenase alpha subunit
MDVLTVLDVVSRVVKRIRETGEAYFLEMNCYRFVGHGVGDDNTQGYKFYRTDQELDEWRKKDPIIRLGGYLEDRGLLTQAQMDAIDEEAIHVVEDAIAFAEASPEPPLDSLYENVFS